jgi:dienelactone hydrolase
MMRIPASLLLALALLAPAARAKDLLEVEVARDLPYVAGEAVDDRHKLDLHTPEGEGPWPVLMWIHGGAWAVGHRRQEEALARRFAERGVAVAAIDHRMSKALWIREDLDEGIEHPEHVKDCAAAFAWLLAHAAERRLDPERMFVGGFSSGAHLSALLATDPKYLKVHGIEPSRIRGALPVGGGYDMVAYYEAHRRHNGEEMADRHVLDVFGRAEGALEDASPITHLHKTKVPMLVLSERDTAGYTKLLRDAVEKAGIERFRFRHFADRTHASMGKLMAREGPDEARDAMIAFIRDPAARPASRKEGPEEGNEGED